MLASTKLSHPSLSNCRRPSTSSLFSSREVTGGAGEGEDIGPGGALVETGAELGARVRVGAEAGVGVGAGGGVGAAAGVGVGAEGGVGGGVGGGGVGAEGGGGLGAEGGLGGGGLGAE